MRDWLDYRLSDLLLFSPRTYYRMFELYHRDVWPLHIVVAVVVVAVAVGLYRGGARRDQLIAGVLAAGWLWVGVMFHIRRYSSINWAATYFGAVFIVQSMLIVWIGVVRRRLLSREASTSRGHVAALVWLGAVLLPPIASRLAGRSWSQAEVFGLTPDATAIATLAVFVFAAPGARRLLAVVPVGWCLIGGATLLALGSARS